MRPFSKLTQGLVGQPMLEILATVTAMEAAGRKIRIPMPGQAESLNVAAAAAICLFETVRQRSR